MANPLIAQGTLNRLRASVVWVGNSSLNVTSSFLGKEGVGLALTGESTTFIKTMTGVVTSPEPFLMVELTIHLLRTQALSDQYKAQMELNSLLGECTVRPDAATLSPYELLNMAIQSVRPLQFAGEDPSYMVSCQGYYNINSDMWNL